MGLKLSKEERKELEGDLNRVIFPKGPRGIVRWDRQRRRWNFHPDRGSPDWTISTDSLVELMGAIHHGVRLAQ